jgi:integrase
LLAEGLPVPAVSKRLGHAHAGVTMAVYAHAIGQGDAGAAEAIGRALGKNANHSK